MYIYAYNMDGHNGAEPAEVGHGANLDQVASNLLISADLYDRETYLLLRLAIVDTLRQALDSTDPDEPAIFTLPDVNLLNGVIRKI
ncbi:MAG: hypothetical protein AB7C95_00720 [Synergistaceae bacterium]